MELLGKKIGMTHVFDAKGNFVAVTVVELGPCVVLQKKTAQSRDKYNAIQIGFGKRKVSRATKPLIGHCKKANVAPVAVIKEVRLPTEPTWNVGDKITCAQFKPGEFVDVIGITKGRGFQGVVRRHKFAGGPASHGQKGWFRRPGAIGERLFPGRVFRGQRMPGHMGHVRVTTQNLRILQVREADNVVVIEGAVPGPKGGVVVVRHAKKKGKVA